MALFLAYLPTFAQEEEQTIEGTVTFITSTNVYVRVSSTTNIDIGDTLKRDGSDCLKVSDKSSTSLVCVVVDNCPVQKDDKVYITVSTRARPEVIVAPVQTEQEGQQAVTNAPGDLSTSPSGYQEAIRGRVTAASYNAFSNERENRTRLYTDLLFNGEHLSGSKFSVQAHMAYRNIIVPSESQYSGRTSIFNLYNLNVQYLAMPTLNVTFGRSINPKASGLGPIDGLQLEKYFGKFYVGLVGGSRPNFDNYGIDTSLLQFGGYFGIETGSREFRSLTTVGAMEQTNSGTTDRRYIFFQHNSTIAGQFNLFSSMELDIYGGPSGSQFQGNSTRLTNLYISGRYRISRAANIMVSYDSRRRVIYYETFQNQLERLLDDDLARQGLRARVNVRPARLLWVGMSVGRRFQSDEQNKSNNLYGYATYTKLPKIGGRFNVSYNRNQTNYLTSNIGSFRYSRLFMNNQLQGEVYYRLADYTYENRAQDFTQHYFGGSFSVQFARSWQFSLSGEYAKFDRENNVRLYTRLVKRFGNRK